MSKISRLLEVQELDLASDQLNERRSTLPEREALRQCHANIADIDAAHVALLERREALGRDERELAGEVGAMASRAQEADDTLYSGTIKVAKELSAVQEEVRMLREKQSALEERQMELLEEIDQLESETSDNRSTRTRKVAEGEEIQQAIGRAEGEIDAELARLVGERSPLAGEVPANILADYERLRTKERMAGRAAAPLADGSCGGCRVRLPVMEYTRMKAEPEDKLLTCTRCSRILVR